MNLFCTLGFHNLGRWETVKTVMNTRVDESHKRYYDGATIHYENKCKTCGAHKTKKVRVK